MAIGHAVQKGTLIYIYGVDGRQTTSISAPGRWPEDGLKGFTPNAVHIQKGSLIYAYDESGRQSGMPVPVKSGNIEYIQAAKRPQSAPIEQVVKYSRRVPEAVSA